MLTLNVSVFPPLLHPSTFFLALGHFGSSSRLSIFKMADGESKTNMSLSWHLATSCSLKAFKNNLATSGNYPCMRQGNGFSAVPRSSISVPRAHVHLGQRLRMRVLDAKLAMTPPVPHSLLLFFFSRSPFPSIFHALTYPHM